MRKNSNTIEHISVVIKNKTIFENNEITNDVP